MSVSPQERIARAFHEEYERLAPGFGYKTRAASAVPWVDVPTENAQLMMSVVHNLLARGVIVDPSAALWECVRCGLSNPPSLASCLDCGAGKPRWDGTPHRADAAK